MNSIAIKVCCRRVGMCYKIGKSTDRLNYKIDKSRYCFSRD